MGYVVDLEAFHGPMDLLLYLIEKNELDIYDIPIAVITDQYMEHLQSTGDYNLDMLGDFLIMASYLLNLKSRMLLPRYPRPDEDGEDGEVSDPREELVQRLLDYKRYKEAGEYLRALQEGEFRRVFFRPEVYQGEDKEEILASMGALTRAYYALWQENEPEQPYNLPQGDINVGDKMEEILKRLGQFKTGLVFQDLFAGVLNRREALALFLALLELVRQQKVTAHQETEFSVIKVYLRVAVRNVDAGGN